MAALAEQTSELRTFALDWPQNAQWLPGNASPVAARARRQASICLHSSNLLDTPDKIAAKLNPRRFALWRNEAQDRRADGR